MFSIKLVVADAWMCHSLLPLRVLTTVVWTLNAIWYSYCVTESSIYHPAHRSPLPPIGSCYGYD
jgi:hypothetical protein